MKKLFITLILIIALITTLSVSAFAYTNDYLNYSIVWPSSDQISTTWKSSPCSSIRFGCYDNDGGEVKITLVRSNESYTKFKYNYITVVGSSGYTNVPYDSYYYKMKIKVTRNSGAWVTGTAYYYTQ